MISIRSGERTVTVSETELEFVSLGWPPFSTDSPLWTLHIHDDGEPCCDPNPFCPLQPDLHCPHDCATRCADTGEQLTDQL